MKKKEYKRLINADLYRYEGNTKFTSFVKSIFMHPGFRYTYLLRKCKYLKEKKNIFFLFWWFLLRHYRYKYGFDIPINTQIGPGLYIGHFGSIVIHPKVKLGCNVNLSHGVTIGLVNRGHRKGTPVIGDKVWIGTHAIIVGNVHIGNNSLIGPGAYVNFDVPENAVVLGNPGKIISYKGSEEYIIRTFEF